MHTGVSSEDNLALGGGSNRWYWLRKQEKAADDRAKLTDAQKFQLWLEQHPSAVNTAKLPVDIRVLPCGCGLPPEDKRRQLHVRRPNKDSSWICIGCEKPVTGSES